MLAKRNTIYIGVFLLNPTDFASVILNLTYNT